MAKYLAIFRVPPQQGEVEAGKTFVEVEVNDGVVSDEGMYFSIDDPEDSYIGIGFDQVVIAEPVEGGSRDLGIFDLIDTDTSEKVCVYALQGDELMASLAALVEAYDESIAT